MKYSTYLHKNAAKSLCFLLSLMIVCLPQMSKAQAIDPAFSALGYTIANIGAAGNTPGLYGSLTFKNSDPSKALIGGNANSPTAFINEVTATRDAAQHITSFTGGTQLATAPGLVGGGTSGQAQGGIDGGLTYGPNNVLFYTSFPDNGLGQIKSGSTAPDKLIDLYTTAGWAAAGGPIGGVGALQFVPSGFPGAGKLKICSWTDGVWHSTTLAADGTGTYNISIQNNLAIGHDVEGIMYLKSGAPGITVNSVALASYNLGAIYIYDIDANGDPVLSTKRTLATGMNGIYGGAQDPVTGDLIYANYDLATTYKITGFLPACNAGTTAPTLSATTKANTCPTTTVDLTTITASNLPSGATLSWHTATPASGVNRVATPSAVAAGTYYAAFYDAGNGCYGGNPGGSVTTTVTATVSTCPPFASTNGTAVVSTFNSCTTASAGTMTASTAVSGVTQTINVTVGTVGTYSISATANGVTFAGTGTFATTGAQNVILTATGTPTAAGSNSFTLNTTPNCSFSRTTVAATSATIDCSKTVISPAPIAGTASQVGLVVTLNVAAAGTITPLSISGSGFTLANGVTTVSTARTGIQTFMIPVNYDGTALGTVNFTIGASGSCSANMTLPSKKTISNVWTLDNCTAVQAGPSLK